MAKFMNTDLMDFGLDRIRAKRAAGNTITLRLITAYTQGDAYATVDGNSILSIPLEVGDLALGNQGTLGRQVQIAAKSGTASGSSQAADDLHFAVLDDTESKVLAATDETTDQVITAGNQVHVPAHAYKYSQPV